MQELIQKFVNWATPKEFNAEGNTHLAFRARVLVLSNLVSVLIVIAASLTHFLSRTTPSLYDYILPSAIGGCCLSFFALKLKGGFRTSAIILIGVLYLLIVSLVVVEGIIFSSTMYWLALLPLYAFFMMGRVPGITAGGISIVAVVAINTQFYSNGLVLRNNWSFDLFAKSVLFDSVGMVFLGLGLGLIFEESRERADLVLQKYQSKIFKQARLAELGEMAGGVAHEINNPLAVIMNFSELTLDQLRADVDVSKQDLILAFERVMVHGRRIDNIVRGLRLYARDGSQDSMEQVAVAALLDDALILCKERASSQGTDLTISLDEFRLDIACRRAQIAQVLINLFTNALDAVEGIPNGKISVRVSVENGQCEITVTDNGPGVPPLLADKIMNPFFTTKPIGKGTGLGLSISSGIAKEHGGQLVLVPSESGAVFSLKIPITQPSQ